MLDDDFLSHMQAAKDRDDQQVTVPLIPPYVRPAYRIFPSHEAADAFWKCWRENGETHKHGHYEATWAAINAALAVAGVQYANKEKK